MGIYKHPKEYPIPDLDLLTLCFGKRGPFKTVPLTNVLPRKQASEHSLALEDNILHVIDHPQAPLFENLRLNRSRLM